jgi:isopentenyl-diphosphate delta-isomerase
MQSNKRDRKLEHIELTDKSQTLHSTIDERFHYEPLLSAHPSADEKLEKSFLGHSMKYPIWISSMTGGTGKAAHINQNLSKAAGEFGLGMGLGSCRMLLESDEYFEDFNLRSNIGEHPFYGNLGVAQVQECLDSGSIKQIENLVERLNLDGLIIHINPLQEWFQPEGDFIKVSPLETISAFLKASDIPVIVKEVGQGMGPKSLFGLMKMPIKAIEFAAYGGTNFAQLEILRNSNDLNLHSGLTNVGHTALNMVLETNKIIENSGKDIQCDNFIISGGVRSYLDGYYLTQLSKGNAVFGMASPFLSKADEGYESLQDYISQVTRGLVFANKFLTVKTVKE